MFQKMKKQILNQKKPDSLLRQQNKKTSENDKKFLKNIATSGFSNFKKLHL